jgi:hypothetical protein
LQKGCSVTALYAIAGDFAEDDQPAKANVPSPRKEPSLARRHCMEGAGGSANDALDSLLQPAPAYEHRAPAGGTMMAAAAFPVNQQLPSGMMSLTAPSPAAQPYMNTLQQFEMDRWVWMERVVK